MKTAFDRLMELREEIINQNEGEENPLTKRELESLRIAERKQRAAKMAAMITPQVLKRLEEEGRHVTDLLPPPEWIVRPYWGKIDLTME